MQDVSQDSPQSNARRSAQASTAGGVIQPVSGCASISNAAGRAVATAGATAQTSSIQSVGSVGESLLEGHMPGKWWVGTRVDESREASRHAAPAVNDIDGGGCGYGGAVDSAEPPRVIIATPPTGVPGALGTEEAAANEIVQLSPPASSRSLPTHNIEPFAGTLAPSSASELCIKTSEAIVASSRRIIMRTRSSHILEPGSQPSGDHPDASIFGRGSSGGELSSGSGDTAINGTVGVDCARKHITGTKSPDVDTSDVKSGHPRNVDIAGAANEGSTSSSTVKSSGGASTCPSSTTSASSACATPACGSSSAASAAVAESSNASPSSARRATARRRKRRMSASDSAEETASDGHVEDSDGLVAGGSEEGRGRRRRNATKLPDDVIAKVICTLKLTMLWTVLNVFPVVFFARESAVCCTSRGQTGSNRHVECCRHLWWK